MYLHGEAPSACLGNFAVFAGEACSCGFRKNEKKPQVKRAWHGEWSGTPRPAARTKKIQSSRRQENESERSEYIPITRSSCTSPMMTRTGCRGEYDGDLCSRFFIMTVRSHHIFHLSSFPSPIMLMTMQTPGVDVAVGERIKGGRRQRDWIGQEIDCG